MGLGTTPAPEAEEAAASEMIAGGLQRAVRADAVLSRADTYRKHKFCMVVSLCVCVCVCVCLCVCLCVCVVSCVFAAASCARYRCWRDQPPTRV